MALLKKQRMAGLLTCAMIASNMSGVMAEVTESNGEVIGKEYVSETNEQLTMDDLYEGTMRTTSSQVEVTTGTQIKVLNASEIPEGNIESEISVNGFTIIPAPSTSSTKVAVDKHGSEQEAIDKEKFIYRLKLGGTGKLTEKTTERLIVFSTSGKAKVTIYAMSGSSSKTDRYLKLCSMDGKEVATFPKLDPATSIHKQTLTIEEAGKYALMSADSGINIYRIIVEELDEGQVESRKPWIEVETPYINQVEKSEIEKNTLSISYTGLIGTDGADQITAKLYDESGKEVSKKTTMAEGTEGSINLEYKASGKYTVQLESSRTDEEEVKISEVFDIGQVLTDLPSSITVSALTGLNASLDVKWNPIDEIEYYEVACKEAASDDSAYQIVEAHTTAQSYNVPNLTIGSTYTVKITGFRGEEKVVGTVTETVKAEKQRWTSANVGSGASGTVKVNGTPVNGDGSVTINATGGKMADSEDGFTYYYTEVDPETENFTMTATFVMDNVDNRDNQSGFGIIALDTLVTGDSNSRYYNSAGSMFTKFSTTNNGVITSKYGFPGGRFITGYTGQPNDAGVAGTRKNIDSAVFDADYRDDEYAGTDLATKPRFFKGEEYTLVLRKSNTGYHASMKDKEGNQIGEEVICYEPDLLLKQDREKTYVGVFASRKIQVTVKDITFSTIAPSDDDLKINRPMTYIDPVISYDATLTSADTNYEAAFKSNVNGTIVIKDAEDQTVATIDGKNINRSVANLKLKEGENKFKAILTPSPRDDQKLEVYEELKSYDPIEMEFTVTNKSFGTSENALYVKPDGKASGEGTKASPLDIYTAVAYAQPGQEIVLLGGTYELTEPIVIERGNSGKAGEPITLMSDPNERAILDFSKSSAGFTLKGDYWHFYGFDICNASKSPIRINGNNNIAEKLNIYNNADTGLQISGFSAETTDMWPSNNLVVSCETYNNADELGNDADGFAAKLTVGTGNVFRYCISHHNIDDGWDLYAKSTTGSIGQVVIENCVTYANGSTLLAPSKTGEGNGFKLGGESMPGNHILRNSISFDNLAKGITSNSGPDCQLFDNTSYGNGAENVSLYTNGKTTNYVIQNIVTAKGGKADKYDFKNQEWTNDGSVYIDGSNGQGKTVNDSWFKSVDTKIVPTIAADGSIDMKGLLELNSTAEGKGAVFVANPNPTVIEIGKEIESKNDPMLENKNWKFTIADFGEVKLEGKADEVHGLLIDATKGKFVIRTQNDAQINAGTIIKVPVDGASTITFTHGYSKGDILVTDSNGYEKTYTFDSSGTWKEDAFAYEGRSTDYITLELKGNYYLRNLSVKAAEAGPRELQVGPTAEYKTVQAALNAITYVPTEKSRVTLSIAPGVYTEEVTVTKPYITFQNADPSKGEVKITYDKASGHDSDATKNKGTQDSASVTIAAAAKGFEAYGITFENSYNLNQDKLGDIATDRKQTQAVAVVTFADQIIFENCKFIGRQDTLYLKGSSKGQTVADANEARVYLKDCYVEGTVDFIFGDSTAVFENCKVHMAYYTNGGHYTAPNTTLSNIGYVFNGCEFTISNEYAEYIDPATGKFKLDEKGNPVKNIDLGRPWQADHTYPNYGSQSVMINCKMDNAIAVDGWKAWDSNTVTNKVRFMEYNSMDLTGKALDLSSRLDWVRILGEEQALAFNTVNVLRGSDNWNPSNGDLLQAVEIADVTLDQYRIELPAGETTSLKTKVLPVITTSQIVTWNSSDEAVATVDANGKVTAVSVGKAEITATTVENGCSVSAEITVKTARTEIPEVKEIKVEANETILPGDVLKGTYTYEKESDNQNDNAKVQWFIVDPVTGEEMLVQEGTEDFDREYRVASGDIGYQIKFAVIPQTETTYGNVGEAVKSDPTTVVAKPEGKVPELYVRESFTNFGDKYEDVKKLDTTSNKKWMGTNIAKAGEGVKTALTLLHTGLAKASDKSAWKVVDTSGKALGDVAYNGNATVASNIEYQNDASILIYNADKVWGNYIANARMRFSPTATGYSSASYWDMYIDYSVETNSGYKVRLSRGGNTNSVTVTLYKVEKGTETQLAKDDSTLANKLKQNAGEENPFFRVVMSNNVGEITAKVYIEGADTEGVVLNYTDETPLAGTVAFENFGKSGCPVMDMLTVEEIIKEPAGGGGVGPGPSEEDKEKPVLSYEGEKTINVAYGAEFKLPEVTVTDNVDQDVVVNHVIKNSKGEEVVSIDTKVSGTYTITYTAKDEAGNEATLEIKVVVAEEVKPEEPEVDKEAPVLHYEGKTTIEMVYGAEFKLPEVTVTDNVDQDVVVNHVIKNSKGEEVVSIDTKVAGTYTITYTAKDATGNEATLVIKVVVAAYVSDDDDYTPSNPSTGTTDTTDTTTPDTDKDIIQNVESGKVPNVEVNKDYKVEVKAETLDKLIDAGLGLVVKGQGVEVSLNNHFLNSAQVIGTAQPVQVAVAPVAEKVAKAVEAQIKSDSKLQMIGDSSMILDLSVKAEETLTSFNEPLALSFDLSKVKVEDASKLTLVSYEAQKDGSIKVVKLGGKYDPVTKTFSALTDKPGQFGVVAAEDLVKVNLTIGSVEAVVNDKVGAQDVAPQIIDGKTMMPLRFIAESLNAEVKWDAKLKQVIIASEGKTITLQVGKDEEYGAIIKDNRTLVPIRYISEQLDAHVLWVPSAKTVEIVK